WRPTAARQSLPNRAGGVLGALGIDGARVGKQQAVLSKLARQAAPYVLDADGRQAALRADHRAPIRVAREYAAQKPALRQLLVAVQDLDQLRVGLALEPLELILSQAWCNQGLLEQAHEVRKRALENGTAQGDTAVPRVEPQRCAHAIHTGVDLIRALSA